MMATFHGKSENPRDVKVESFNAYMGRCNAAWHKRETP